MNSSIQGDLDNLPLDVIKAEIIPKMNFVSLANMARTSKVYGGLATDYLKQYLANRGLQKEGWGPERMFRTVAKYETLDPRYSYLQKYFVKEYLERLHRKEDVLGFYLTNPKLLTDEIKESLAANRNVQPDDLLKYPQIFPSHLLSSNPNVTPQYVANHPNIAWNYEGLARNDNFSVSYIMSKPGTNSLTIDEALSRNESTTYLDYIYNLDWNIYALYANPNFGRLEIHHLEMEDASPEYGKLWTRAFSENPNFIPIYLDWLVQYDEDLEDFLETENSDKKGSLDYFRWDLLSRSPNITAAYIKKHPDWPWYEQEFLKNPNLTPSEAYRLLNAPKDENSIYFWIYNPNLTISDIINDPDYLPRDSQWIVDNNFSRDPGYRKMMYNYIYNLLPNIIYLTLDKEVISESKEYMYGVMLAIKTLGLNYDIKYIIAHDMELSLEPDDYPMFTYSNIDDSYFLIIVNDRPFFFRDNDFLEGFKYIYEANNIPLNVTQYYDRKDYSKPIPI